uniref:SH2 domain-containing protein n=1 Tax=Romanomermis culicivorax TaxID=13658 RepID=A0A915J636_ROMCU
TFVVRHSSHSNSRALSVRLANLNKNNNADVEHYLIEICPSLINGKIRLHGSEKSFSALPFLIEYYFNDEKYFPNFQFCELFFL